MIGRRWNVRWENLTLYLPEQVTHIAKAYGTLHIRSAVDYFIIANNEFPWDKLPDVVIARRGYDNFVVMMAVQENVSVVDISNTLVAVHQTDKEAKDSRRHIVNYNINMEHLGRFRSEKGLTSNAQYLTTLLTDKLHNTNNIVIMRRRTTRRYNKRTSIGDIADIRFQSGRRTYGRHRSPSQTDGLR